MSPLPIDAVLSDLLAALAVRNSVVLQAPPGAGKTTRVPLALLHADWLAGKKILMLEPRRLAARAAARWMAKQLDEAAGETVGYRMRLDTRVSAATRIEVVTEGVLTRLLQDDPALTDYGVVIFDEFHERSLHADLGLALVRESQQALREDLRVLVMSATLDAAPVAALLTDAAAGAAPMITSAGRAWPVSTRYLAPGRKPWLEHLLQSLPEILASEAGSMLVFLPGAGEIRRVQSQLQQRLPDDIHVLPLYGDLRGEAQDAAIAPAATGERKVVLATAIAETSLTIDGVRIVVDAGWQRRAVFDPGSAMTRLITSRVSGAAADQRRGRAGRTAAGVCIRLWAEGEQLSPFTAPEILAADLSGVVLELAQWGVRDPLALSWLDAPPLPAWTQACTLLRLLGAIDPTGAITGHGRDLLAIPLSPRLAHMVVRGREWGYGRLAAEIAALLSERDLLGRAGGVDLHARIDALRGEAGGAVDHARLALVRDSARRLYPSAAFGKSGSGKETAEIPEAAGLLLALAYPDRVAKQRSDGGHRYLLANGRGALLPEGDVLAKSTWIVCADMDGDARETRIYLAAPVTQAGIERVLADVMAAEDFVGWDAASESVVARRRRKLGAILVEEKLLPVPSPEQVQAAMVSAIRERGLLVLPWSEKSLQWRARVQLLHGLDAETWPDMSDAALLATLDEWLVPCLSGMSRLAHLKNVPLLAALATRLHPALRQQLDTLAPVSWTVPTGSVVSIDYTADNGPVLAVKLQEMFGALQTPTVANGRVPLTLHLLSPARRPAAVTRDLPSFWRQGYPDVRRDLRGRYPRHPWPEDPLAALPQRGVKLRR